MLYNRRDVLKAGAAVIGAASLGGAGAFASGKAAKKILFFTKSAGFQHSVITRQGEKLGLAERIMLQIGKDNGFDIVVSKDGSLFNPDQIGQFDAFHFHTTGDLTTAGTDKTTPMTPEGKKAFLQAIEGGKGFIGTHCATDTFHSSGNEVDPYIKMIGGEFRGHGAQQVAKLEVADLEFPGVKPFGEKFELNDEWYSQKNLADDLHVIIAHNTKGMQGHDYDRPNFPETWARMHGQGKVFYSSMGHREDVWENPKFQGLLIGALKWVTGLAEHSVEANVQKVTPDYKTEPS